MRKIKYLASLAFLLHFGLTSCQKSSTEISEEERTQIDSLEEVNEIMSEEIEEVQSDLEQLDQDLDSLLQGIE
jgi:ubiquinone biosynthesis protein UbiJ